MIEKQKKNSYNIGSDVRVRSAENIAKSLDSWNKLEGCLFMDQMWEYCGQKFKIVKVVSNFFDEYRFKMFKTKSPLYILDGLICHGKVKSFDYPCDRSCFLFWHENWLTQFED